MNAASTTMPLPRVDLALPVQVDPILVRDPFLEFLGLVSPREPIAVTFPELVKAAGHLCPTVAGAYLILRHGLTALYGSEPAVRGEVRVTAYGGPQDFGYGPIAQLVNLVIGAAPETGFAGLHAGLFARRDLFIFNQGDLRRNEFDFERLDLHRTVHVTYDPGKIPPPAGLHASIGPALGAAVAPADLTRFRTLWMQRVHDILSAADQTVHVAECEV